MLRWSLRKRLARSFVAAAALAMVVVAGSAGHVGAQSGADAGAGEAGVAPSAGNYEGEYQIRRAPDVYVFGFVRDGTMMVPVRPVAEAYGATVHWVAGVGTLVNGHLVEAVTVLGQAYSPARELANILGCWLEWDQAGRTVTLSNGIQRVIISVPATSWAQPDAPADKVRAGPGSRGADPVVVGGAVVSGPGSGPGPGPGPGSGPGAEPGSGPAARQVAGQVGGSGIWAIPGGGLATVVQSPGPPGQATAAPVTIAPAAPQGASHVPGASGEGPVVIITPLPGPTAPPGEGPDGGAGRRIPGERVVAGKIALTFDDGPDPVYTKKILEVLERCRVKATFFLIGSRVERYPAIVRGIAAAGHELGNHGYSHSRLTTLSQDAVRREISRTQEAVKAAANATPRWFRPPYGSYNKDIQRIAKEEGASTVLWTLNPDDWRSPGEAAIVKRVTAGAKDSAIVLLHVREQTAVALPAIIEGLVSQGYELVLLSELLAGDTAKPAPRAGQGAGGLTEPSGQPQGASAGHASDSSADAAAGVEPPGGAHVPGPSGATA